MWCSLGQAITSGILRIYWVAFRWILCLSSWCLIVLPHVYLSINWVLVLAVLPAAWDLLIVVLHCLIWWPCHYIGMRSSIGVVFLAIIGRKLILVLQEGVLMALWASRSIWNVASNVAAACPLTLAWWVDLEELLASLVHVGGAWVLVWEVAAMGHWACQRVFRSNRALSFLILRFHRFCSRMMPVC